MTAEVKSSSLFLLLLRGWWPGRTLRAIPAAHLCPTNSAPTMGQSLSSPLLAQSRPRFQCCRQVRRPPVWIAQVGRARPRSGSISLGGLGFLGSIWLRFAALVSCWQNLHMSVVSHCRRVNALARLYLPQTAQGLGGCCHGWDIFTGLVQTYFVLLPPVYVAPQEARQDV